MSDTDRILIVEEDGDLAKEMSSHLHASGFFVETQPLDAPGFPDTFTGEKGFDLLIIGLNGNADIRRFFDDLRARSANTAIIVITASPDLDEAVSCLKGGAYDYLSKPITMDTLVQSIHQALENRKLFLNIITLSEDLKDANTLLAKQKDEIEREKNLLDRLLLESNLASDTRKLAAMVVNKEKLIEDFFFILSSFSSYDGAALLLDSGNKPYLIIDDKKRLEEDDLQEIREIMLSGAGITSRMSMVNIGHRESGGKDADRKAAVVERQIMPLMINDEFLGSIGIFSTKKNRFTPEVKNFLKIMGAEFAMVAKLLHLYQQNKMLSVTDGLTRIYNNRYFQEVLARDFDRIKRYNGRLSLILLDVDNFKSINDNFGHQQGDLVLIEMAQILKKNTRKSDFVARYGGEEFVVVMPETEAERGLILAENLRRKVASHCFSSQGGCRTVTVSIGLAEMDETVPDQFELVGRADQALYHAKRTGKNKVSAYQKDGRIVDLPHGAATTKA